MIRVTIELLPGGDPARARVLRTVDVQNVSGGTSGMQQYLATMTMHVEDGPLPSTRRAAFEHRVTDGVETCVIAALRAVGR